MSILKKLAGQSAIYGLSSIVGRFLNYLLVPLHTNIFINPGEYGVVTEIYAYISFLMIIYTYGMETSFFHFSEKTSELKNKVFGTGMMALLTTTFVFSGALILFSDSIANVLEYPNHSEYVVWLALILGFDALTALPFARLRQQQRATRFASLKLINISINIFFNLLFFLILPKWFKGEAGMLHSIAKTIYNPEIRVGYVFIANLLASFITLLLMLPEIRIRRSDFDRDLLNKIILYSLPLLVAGLAGMVNETLDRIMIKYLIPDHTEAMNQLGIYGACYKLSILMTLFIQAYRYAAEPFFFSQYTKEDARSSYAVLMKYFSIACAIIFLGIMMYIDIFKYFIGEPYRTGLHIVPILLLANMCLGIFFNLSMWYKLTGQTRYGAYFSIFGAVITILFNLLLIPAFGYTGAAWATLICYFSMMAASFFTGQKQYKIPYETKKILMYLGFSVALYFVTVLLYHFIDPGTGIKLTINTLVLASFLFVISRYERPPSIH